MTLLRELLFPLIAVVAAFIVGGILILIIGDNPLQAYGLLFGSALSWPVGIGYTLFYATPLIFTGLAVLVAFRCGLRFKITKTYKEQSTKNKVQSTKYKEQIQKNQCPRVINKPISSMVATFGSTSPTMRPS